MPVLGFNVPEALLLQSNGESTYHGAQFSVTNVFLEACTSTPPTLGPGRRHELNRSGQHGGRR